MIRVVSLILQKNGLYAFYSVISSYIAEFLVRIIQWLCLLQRAAAGTQKIRKGAVEAKKALHRLRM